MTIYLLRHGQSQQSQGIFQDDMVSLSPQGINQVKEVARKLAVWDVSEIWTSPLPRARETANAIANVFQKPVQIEPLVEEWRKPSELLNRSFEDPKAQTIIRALQANRDNPHYQYSDEESFAMVCERAQRVLRLFEEEATDRLLVITHGHLMRLIICLLQYPNFTQHDYWELQTKIPIPNTHILELSFTPAQGWQVA